ncbi:MAG: hypothetical protein ACJ74U_20115 [Jatrophihabitantaceae bacterium]
MTLFSIGRAGWVRFESADCPPTYLRYLPDEIGRWTLRELMMDASESPAITAATLAALPLAQIEFNVNYYADLMEGSQEGGQTLSSAVGGPAAGSNVAVLASHFATGFVKYQPEKWVALAQQGKQVGKERRAVGAKRPTLDVDYRLTEPPPGRLTDEFLGKVARAYAAAMVRGEAPLQAMIADLRAAGAGDYRRAVERWVATARKRGVMPPGKKGARG